MAYRSFLPVILSLGLVACGGSSTEEPSGSASAAPPQNAGFVNVYSARHYDSDKALYEQFEQEIIEHLQAVDHRMVHFFED